MAVVRRSAPAGPSAPKALRPVPPGAPHGRLGLLWAAATAAAVFGGRWTLALWMSAGATVALLAVRRAWQEPLPRATPALLLAAGGPLAAAAGGDFLVGLFGAGLLVIGVATWRGPDPHPAVGAAGLLLGLGLGCLVLIDAESVTLVALVLALSACYGASRYLVGWGASSPWEGPLAGLAALGSASLVVAVVQPAPVVGAYPWILGALVAAAAPVGRLLCPLLEARLPVGPLRRYDALVVVAPACLLLGRLAHL